MKSMVILKKDLDQMKVTDINQALHIQHQKPVRIIWFNPILELIK